MLSNNKYHEQNNTKLLQLIETSPLATLVWQQQNQLASTYLPLIYCKKRQVLIGHAAKKSPIYQALASGETLNAIFNGPDCYISPTDSPLQKVPTWHYAKVHATGIAKLIDEPSEARALLAYCSDFFEQQNNTQWQISTLPEVALCAMLNEIAIFEIQQVTLTGQFKVSQHKSDQLKTQLIASLNSRNQGTSAALIEIA